MNHIITIEQGKHRGSPRPFGLHWDRKEFTAQIGFTDSCKYEKDDEKRIQKLWGIGFIPGFHVQNSARIGWRYNPYADGFDIMAFVHDAGRMTTIIGNEVRLKTIKSLEVCETSIFVSDSHYTFTADDVLVTVNKTHSHKLSYPLGAYFEDQNDQAAPHNMSMMVKRR